MIEVMKDLKGVKALFSTRHKGVSRGLYESLNLGFHVGDYPKAVKQNHTLVQAQFKQPNEIIYMHQIHSDQVCEVGHLDGIATADSLISKQKNKILMVMVADCMPLLFFDPVQGGIAAIHAGRKGAFLNIVSETLKQMQQRFRSDVKDIRVAIGPHIGSCCYEIGSEVVEEAKTLKLAEMVDKREASYYLDIYAIVLKQLSEAGIKQAHIERHNICTACHTESFFSYRKEGTTGRFCGVIMLE